MAISKGIIVAFGLSLAMFGFGIFLWYEVDSTVDYDILNEQFYTNQTFVDELDCEKIKLTINTLKQLHSPTQQDEVDELLINFEQINIEKCESDVQK